MTRIGRRVAFAAGLFAMGTLVHRAGPAQQAQVEQSEITVYKSPT